MLLVYLNSDNDVKRINGWKCCSPKRIIVNYNIIINGKKFYEQTIDPDINRYEELRNVTTRQGEDYTAGCWLGFDYIKKVL